MLEHIGQNFNDNTYIVFNDNNNENIFAFPNNTDLLDNLVVQSGFSPIVWIKNSNPAFYLMGTILKRISVFDQDNPAAKNTNPLNQMENFPPFFCTQKSMGNRFSVPFFSNLATNPFTDPVPLTSDLEPDCSIYKLLIFMRTISQSFCFFSKIEEFSTIFSKMRSCCYFILLY